jgi:hypothetical protein
MVDVDDPTGRGIDPAHEAQADIRVQDRAARLT